MHTMPLRAGCRRRSRAVPALRGFTLIEVMIVVAVMAILAAVAYPSYMEYVRRAHRADARAALHKASQWMERVATANGNYPVTTDATQKTAILGLQSQLSTPRYTIAIASTDLATYVATATPQGVQQQDRCGTLSLDQAGQRDVKNLPSGSSANAAECWSR